MLTSQQIAHFQAFGFLVMRQIFSSAEADTIRREYDEVWDEAAGGRPFGGERTEAQMTFCERRASLTKLAEDDRIYGQVEQLLGPDIIWGGSGAARYVDDSFWHKDDYGGLRDRHGVIKVVMYFEPVERETGCLRIIPGSHRSSFTQALRPLDRQHDDASVVPFGVAGRDIPSHAMETQPTDLIIFDSTA